VAVRKWNTGGRITCGIGACGIAGAWSFAGIVYAEGTGPEFFQSYDGAGLGEANSRYAVGREESKLALYRNGGSFSAAELPAKEWLFVGVSKASGTVVPKLYIYRFSTKTWSISEGSGPGIANALEGATAVAFGEWNKLEQFRGKMAAAAIYNKALTEAEMKALVAVPELQDWLATSPKGLWLFGQASTATPVEDLTGNGANETSSVNTEVIEETPPIPYVEGEEGGEEEGGGMQIFDGAAIVEAGESVLVEGALVVPTRSILIEGALVTI
jgi:hypothetical protein